MDGHADRRMDGHADRRMDGHADRRMDGHAERHTDITKQIVAFATLQTHQRSCDVTLLYIVTDIRNIKRYLLVQRKVTGKRKHSTQSTTQNVQHCTELPQPDYVIKTTQNYEYSINRP